MYNDVKEQFENIKAAAEKLGCGNMEDVQELLEKLAVGLNQSESGKTIDGNKFFEYVNNGYHVYTTGD